MAILDDDERAAALPRSSRPTLIRSRIPWPRRPAAEMMHSNPMEALLVITVILLGAAMIMAMVWLALGTSVNLSDSEYSRANLQGMDLHNAAGISAALGGAKVTRSNLSHADLQKANLKLAKFYRR